MSTKKTIYNNIIKHLCSHYNKHRPRCCESYFFTCSNTKDFYTVTPTCPSAADSCLSCARMSAGERPRRAPITLNAFKYSNSENWAPFSRTDAIISCGQIDYDYI